MKRYLVLALKIVGGLVAAIVVILVAAAFLLNSSSIQNKELKLGRGNNFRLEKKIVFKRPVIK